MILRIEYTYNGNPETVEINCSNYTFGFPVLFNKFLKKHPEGLKRLQADNKVKDVVFKSFYNDEWRTVNSAFISFK